MAAKVWKPTPAQKSAVESRAKKTLVSAGAGSGKTAVLVERIVKRVMEDGENRTNIDNMLVVTFTKAAAAEMKAKINEKLRNYETDHSHEAERRRRDQLNCIDDADICTIDSFCIKCVRSFAQEAGISPDFRTCDPAEDAVIIEEAARAVIADYYRSESKDAFIELTRHYSDRNNDEKLIELITGIYNFIQSYAVPSDKLKDMFRFYLSDGDIFTSEWAVSIIKEQAAQAGRIIAQLKNSQVCPELFNELLEYNGNDAEHICSVCGKTPSEKLTKTASEAVLILLDGVRKLSDIASGGEGRETWDKMAASLKDLRTPAKPKGKAAWLEDIKEGCGYFAGLADKMEIYITESAEETERQHNDIRIYAALIVKAVEDLSVRVEEVKHRRGAYSFSDIEHYAYKLLTSKENTEIAQLYRSRYTDILIDEYQDTNGLQDAIFSQIAGDENMLFMVGDLKQSIYAFRGGDPGIFKEKGREYTPYEKAADGENAVRIDLADNFRSNSSVVNSVNAVFGCIMSDELGDVDYVKRGEYLKCGRNAVDTDEMKRAYADKRSEIAVIPFITKKGDMEPENGAALDRETIEARYVARRIRAMVDNKELICSGGEIRPVQYRDFTIIANSVKNIVNIYSEALGREGVPLGIPMIGYYDLFEISVVYSFLKILVNRRADAALITVMRSPIGSFSDDELAVIGRLKPENIGGYPCAGNDDSVSELYRRAEYAAKEPFYERLVWAAKNGAMIGISPALVKKSAEFIEKLEHFESYKHYKDTANIIYDIYTETGFYDFVGAMEGGIQAQRNLTLFYERAKKYTESGSNSLYSFVRYVEKLRSDSDSSEGASAAGESRNVVRMMTIHKSKGLEFPIVFAVSCGKNFRAVDTGDWIIHREAGIGLKYTDPEKKRVVQTPLYRRVRTAIKRESRSEDVRKLYVLMTRARERLICAAALNVRDKEKYNEELSVYRELGEKLRADAVNRSRAVSEGRGYENTVDISGAKGFYEWILGAYFACEDKENEAIEGSGASWSFDDSTDAKDYYTKDVYSIIKSAYAFEKLTGLPSKVTVSKIKEERNEREREEHSAVFEPRYVTDLEPLPEAEDNKPRVAANILGTAYHKVMELSEPGVCADAGEVKKLIGHLAEGGALAEDAAAEIDAEKIAAFFSDKDMGQRIFEAYKHGRLRRESPFEIAIEPDKYDERLSGGDYTAEDKILLQGTIDCWFEEEDGYVIIDYKTDRKPKGMSAEDFASEKAHEYAVQLELYSEAVNMLGEKKVKEKYLYLFSTGRFARVE